MMYVSNVILVILPRQEHAKETEGERGEGGRKRQQATLVRGGRRDRRW